MRPPPARLASTWPRHAPEARGLCSDAARRRAFPSGRARPATRAGAREPARRSPRGLRAALKALFASNRSELRALRRIVRRLLARARRQARRCSGHGARSRESPPPLRGRPWRSGRGWTCRARASRGAGRAGRRGPRARARRIGAGIASEEGLRAISPSCGRSAKRRSPSPKGSRGRCARV